ncbi:MAG TPA: hypothetical protein DCQ04_04280 [Actinobacteria bacterium]|nr:hypothetical protein [Actinomycetota bacterium]
MTTSIAQRAAASSLLVRPITRPDHIATAPLELVAPLDSGEQQALDLEFTAPKPFVPVIVPNTPGTGLSARSPESWDNEDTSDEFFERQPTTSSQLPEPQAWAQRYGQAWVEACGGRRSLKQLSRWSTPQVLAQLQSSHRVATTTRHSRSPQALVRSIRVDEPADGIVEVAAIVRTPGRSRALTLRLEGWDGRWICTFAAML